jgi:hypothetical protein
MLHFSGEVCEVLIGNSRFSANIASKTRVLIPVMVDDVVLIGFSFEDVQLLLHVTLFNETVLVITRNELVYFMTPWDIEITGKTISIREKRRKFLVKMTFEPPNRVIIERARLLCNGVELLVFSDHMLLTNNNTLISEWTGTNVQAGLVLGTCSIRIGAMAHFSGIPRYLVPLLTSR